MIANVGMEYAVASVISAYTPGSAITYGTGFVVSEARGAELNWETEDGEFFGDDVRLDSMNGVIGYTLDFENAGIDDAVRSKLLGDVKASSGNTYSITGAPAPDVGFGFMTKVRENSGGTVAEKYRVRWFHKLKFSQMNESAKTKEKTVEWNTPTLSGKGDGVYLSSGQEDPYFEEHETVASKSAAKSWLNGKAGIS